MKYSALMGERSKTKIVCTLGPASDSSEMIRELISKGMSVARFNLSHGSLESHLRCDEPDREREPGQEFQGLRAERLPPLQPKVVRTGNPHKPILVGKF